MTLIEGDGIGPEISNAVQDIFAAAKVHYCLHTEYLIYLCMIGSTGLGEGKCQTGFVT